MSRVVIELPETLPFRTEIPVLIGHVNRGNHLGNDAVVSLLNEARLRFTLQRGFSENDASLGLMMVNADLAMTYHSEGHYGEVMVVDVGVTGFHRCGYDVVYQVSERESGRAIARAKTAHILIDSASGKTVSEPAGYFDPLRGL